MGGENCQALRPSFAFVKSIYFGFLPLQGWESVTTGAGNYLQGWKLQGPAFHQLCTPALCRRPAICVGKGARSRVLCNLCFTRYSH